MKKRFWNRASASRLLKTGGVILALLLPLGVLSDARAELVLTDKPLADGTAAPAPAISITQEGVGQVITWDGSTGIAVNTLVGADSFYDINIFGQNVFGQGTVVANVEAGYVWNGHEITTQVQNFYKSTDALGLTDIHATWVGSIIAGYDPLTTGSYPYYKLGIAPLTQLHSGAIATSWTRDPVTSMVTNFEVSPASFYNTYNHFFSDSVSRSVDLGFGTMAFSAPADVINSSWGYTDPAGTDAFTMAADGLARAHPQTALVVSAGNSGDAANSVGGPASGYNTIAVGAVGDYSVNNFTAVVDFSSRGPQDYYDPVNGLVKGVRAPVSLVAPGTSLLAAYYDVQDGANNLYSYGLAGTSFAAPIVSGGISLLKSTSYLTGMPDASRDTRVIKSVILNSATPLAGWNNGQHVVGNVTVTTQSLDWAQGAGMLNLKKALDQYVGGTADVSGTGGGTVKPTGWDFGAIDEKAHNDYAIDTGLTAGSTLNVTLAWFRNLGAPDLTDNSNPALQLTTADLGFANLDLELWNSAFTQMYAISMSSYNDTEQLRYVLPTDGTYGLRVSYTDQIFGTPVTENYGLSWSLTDVPEPGSGLLLIAAVFFACPRRPLRRRTG